MIFAEVSFRVTYGALEVRSLRKFKVSLHRRTPLGVNTFAFFGGPKNAATLGDNLRETRLLVQSTSTSCGGRDINTVLGTAILAPELSRARTLAFFSGRELVARVGTVKRSRASPPPPPPPPPQGT